jgi:CubicO group peptidase (beta-lactamase class C family)
MKTARPFALFIVALVIAANISAQEKQIDTLLKQYHEYGQFNGAVLVADRGKVIYEKGFGMANMERDILDFRFWILD